VENSCVLNDILKFKQKSILHKLRLQERLLVDGAVKKTLEADVPEEVSHVLVSKEVLAKWTSKVAELVLEKLQRARFSVHLNLVSQITMHQAVVGVVLFQ